MPMTSFGQGVFYGKSDFLTPQLEPTIFNVDANNVLTLVYNLIASKMTRHINRRELIVRERQDEGSR